MSDILVCNFSGVTQYFNAYFTCQRLLRFSTVLSSALNEDGKIVITFRSKIMVVSHKLFLAFCKNKLILMHTHIHTYTHTHTHIHTHTYTYTYTHIHIHIQRNTHACIDIYIQFLHSYLHASVHTYMHTHTYIHTYLHAHIHACIQGGSNMTRTDLCVNKPHCAAAVRP